MNEALVKRSLILFIISEIIFSIGIGITLFSQPFLYAASGLNESQIGFLFALNFVCGGVTALLGGSVADRVGTTRIFLLASFILPTGYLLLGVSHSLFAWGLSVCMTGIGASLLVCTENIVLKSLAQRTDAAKLLSKFTSMYTVAMAIGAIASGYLSPLLGYGHTILLGASIGFIAPIMRFWVKAPYHTSDKMFRMPPKRIFGMCVYALVYAISIGLINPFLTLILKQSFGFGDSITSLFLSLNMFCMGFGAFAVSFLLHHFKRRKTLLYSFSAACFLTVLLSYVGNGWVFIAICLGRAIVSNIPGSIVDASFMELTEKNSHAQMFGVRLFGTNVGNAIGSYAGGIMLNRQLLHPLLLVSAAGVIIAYITLYRIYRRLNQSSVRLNTDWSSSELS